MKKIILIMSIFASLAAFASGREKTITSYTTVLLNRNYPMNQVCIDNDMMRTIEKQKVCTRYRRARGSDGDRECVSYNSQFFSKPLQYQAKECIKYVRRGGSEDRRMECIKYQTVTKNLPLTYTKTVTLYKWRGGNRNGEWQIPGKVISKTKHNVAYCK